MKNPLITYIILNWNPFSLDHIFNRLHETIKNLYDNSDKNIKKEVYIINQDYSIYALDKMKYLKDLYNFNIVVLDKNIGISAGINIGLNLARGKIIALLTYDVQMPIGCDVSCVNLLESSNDIYQVIPSDSVSDVISQHNSKESKSHSIIGAELTLTYYNRETIKNIGYYDEIWKACYENNDYNLRTVIYGKKILINNEIIIGHHHHTSGIHIGLHQAYSDYLPNALHDGSLTKLWTKKWPEIEKYLNVEGLNVLTSEKIEDIGLKYKDNIYLPFVQERSY